MQRDCDLLQDFVERGADEAFRTLVERHSGMVHGVALRVLRDEGLAQEVTQAVFILLARKASRLPRGTVLAGWLHRSTRFVALEAARAERHRQQHHEAYAQMNASLTTHSWWNQVEPLFDEVMDRLVNIDRDAVVLRFLEGRSFAEVAAALGTTEAAAKMRVGRALEKLRSAFARRGVAVPAAALLATLSAHGVSAAPAGLSTTVTAVALAKEAATGSALINLVEGTLKAMAWSKIKSGLIIGSVVLFLTSGVVFFQQRSTPQASSVSMSVTSLGPMAGVWAGTFERRGGGVPDSTQAVALSVRTTQADRFCEIEMRVFDALGRPSATYHFTHALNQSGNRINTLDDPQIARMSGEGVITESANDPNSAEWRIAFRTPGANAGRYSECRIVRKGDELNTTRSDWISGPRGLSQLLTELKLRRVGAKAVP